MELTKHGNLMLRETGGPDGEARLVSTLQGIYPAHTAQQIKALFLKPRPFILIRGIREVNARKLIESLRIYGVSLQFVPSDQKDQPGVSRTTPDAQAAADLSIKAPPPRPDPQTAAPPGISMATPPGLPGQVDQPETRPQPRKAALKFTGSAGEYFRIWIVNVALTILTLGIYGAWAKVRTRRYFHANTLLDGQPFDYLAKPGTILKGHLIVVGALVVMNVSGSISPLIGSLITVAGWSLVPWLLYKAHRFKAKNSAYRNIRFRFTGSAGGAYKAYALIPLAFLAGFIIALPTLLGGQGAPSTPAVPGMMMVIIMILVGVGFAASFPFFVYLQRDYLHDNLTYGKTGSRFRGRPGRFYGVYLKAMLMMIGAFFAGGLVMGILVPLIVGLSRGGGKPNAIAIFGVGFISYVIFFLFILLVQQYVYASIFNYAWGNTQLGHITFDVSLRARDLAWIRFTNVLAIVFSLGLMAPWAKVRRTRYILPRTVVTLPGEMDFFEAAEDYKEGAVGDTAADFFDWDIGW